MSKELVVVPLEWYKNQELKRLRDDSKLNIKLTSREIRETTKKKRHDSTQNLLEEIKKALDSLKAARKTSPARPPSPIQPSAEPAHQVLTSTPLSASDETVFSSPLAGTPNSWSLFLNSATKNGKLLDPKSPDKPLSVDLSLIKRYIYDKESAIKNPQGINQVAEWYEKLGLSGDKVVPRFKHKLKKVRSSPIKTRLREWQTLSSARKK